MNKKIIFISGAISSDLNYKEKFDSKQKELEDQGYIVLNPTRQPKELEYDTLMELSFNDIEISNVIYFLKGWHKSDGANEEYCYAKGLNRGRREEYELEIIFEE